MYKVRSMQKYLKYFICFLLLISNLTIFSSDFYSFDNYYSSYLDGKYYFKKGYYKKSINYFSSNLSKSSPIRDYALYYTGLSYYKLKDYSRASQYFKSLRSSYPESQFYYFSIYYEGESYSKLSAWNTIINTFSNALNNNPERDSKVRYLYYIAYAYKNKSLHSKALSTYAKVLRFDHSTYNGRAIDDANDILSGFRIENNSDLIFIAREFIRKTKYRKALQILNNINISGFKKDPFYIKYYKALCYLNLNKRETAQNIFKDLKNSYSHDYKKYALSAYQYYKSLENYSYTKALRGYYQLVRTNYEPISIQIASKLAQYYNKQQNHAMKAYYLYHLARFNKSAVIWNSLFNDLNNKRLQIIVNNYPGIVKELSDQFSKSKMYFWIGVSAIQLRDYSSAQNYFAKSYLSYRYDYYSYKSLLFLNNYKKKGYFSIDYQTIRSQSLAEEQSFYSSSEYINRNQQSHSQDYTSSTNRIIQRILFFYKNKNTNHLGDSEVKHFLSTAKDNYKFYLKLINHFNNHGKYQQSIWMLSRYIRYLNGGLKSKNYIPKYLIKLYYPKYFENYVLNASRHHGVNKYLVLAVIREESRFNPYAHSWAGARGLMQIMPMTGRSLARQRKLMNYDLFHAKTNIDLGTLYLSQLIRSFDSYSYAIASYNGGPGRIRGFINRVSNGYYNYVMNGEHLIELIPVNETRNYVKKVLASFYCYLDLYGTLN